MYVSLLSFRIHHHHHYHHSTTSSSSSSSSSALQPHSQSQFVVRPGKRHAGHSCSVSVVWLSSSFFSCYCCCCCVPYFVAHTHSHTLTRYKSNTRYGTALHNKSPVIVSLATTILRGPAPRPRLCSIILVETVLYGTPGHSGLLAPY